MLCFIQKKMENSEHLIVRHPNENVVWIDCTKYVKNRIRISGGDLDWNGPSHHAQSVQSGPSHGQSVQNGHSKYPGPGF